MKSTPSKSRYQFILVLLSSYLLTALPGYSQIGPRTFKIVVTGQDTQILVPISSVRTANAVKIMLDDTKDLSKKQDLLVASLKTEVDTMYVLNSNLREQVKNRDRKAIKLEQDLSDAEGTIKRLNYALGTVSAIAVLLAVWVLAR